MCALSSAVQKRHALASSSSTWSSAHVCTRNRVLVTAQILKEKRYSHTVPKGLLRSATLANYGANPARISQRFAEEVYMLGQPYRLIKATIAVVRNVARQVCQVLPEGSVVIVESSSDIGQRVNIRCENQELWMFAADLDERGNLLLEGGEMPKRTTETAYSIASMH
jgi:hypothetical protein